MEVNASSDDQQWLESVNKPLIREVAHWGRCDLGGGDSFAGGRHRPSMQAVKLCSQHRQVSADNLHGGAVSFDGDTKIALNKWRLLALPKPEEDKDEMKAAHECCSTLTQKFLSNKFEDCQFKKLFDNSTPIDRACLLSISSPHASAWLSVTPSLCMGLHLEPSEFQVTIKWWLGIPVAHGQSCSQCNAALDAYGHHAQCCKLGDDVVSRHNRLRDIFNDFCYSACLAPQLEMGGWSRDRTRLADVLVPNWVLDLYNNLVDPPDSLTPDSVDNSCSSLTQKFLSNKIEDCQFRKLFDNSTPIDRACLLSISSPHASAWLSVTPSPSMSLHLEPSEFQVTIKWWLGIPVAQEMGGWSREHTHPADVLVPNWVLAKVASDKVMFEMASLLSPRQLGYGVSKGAEAAVHAARFYFKNIGSNKVFLKLDFRNAFNSIRRDRMLEAVHHLAPSIYSFVHSVYSSSSLFWSDKIILSSEGVQQGDPLGPLLFCLTIHHMCSRLKSELCIFYLDDGTRGGLLSDILHDIEMIKKEAGIVGLELNPQKSEVVGNNSELIAGIQSMLPGVRVVDPAVATLLGSPIGGTESLDAAIDTKTAMLKCLRERFRYITCHDAYLLLRHSLAIPKLLYLLRTSPCFLSPSLKIYDDELRATICSSFNIHLIESDSSWIQSILPVNCGGLGIRSAVQLAPSAFLASAAASSELAHMILPTNMQPTQLSYVDEALVIWSQGYQEQPLTGVAAHHQKSWDSLRLFSMADTLLKNTTDELNRARLLAASCKESGAWLNALPITSLGLRMDDTTIRISMGLRLGIPLCRNHICQHCGAEVSQFATHGLSCKRSAGRHYRHSAMNDIIHRALVAAHVPSRLEPSGLYRSDGKRPDGITTDLWKCGQFLVWDATCPDTYAPSYSTIAAQQAGAVAQQAEDKKTQKYKHLSSHHFFTPVAIETSGVYGPRTADFLKELGHQLRQVSGEASSFHYLAQRLSVAIQRGNSASVMWTMDGDGEEFFV
eukprot:Em0013g1006a